MNKRFIISIAIFATIGAGAFIVNQNNIYNRVENEIIKVEKELNLLESNSAEIEKQLEYVGSLEFVEYIARTQLKYVMPDEIVFVDEENFD